MRKSLDIDDVSRPVIALADEYHAGFTDPLHSHRRAQLLYASAGVMSVTTEHGSYAVPPQRAVWLPAGTAHEVSCRGRVSLRTLYMEPEIVAHLPGEVTLIAIADLLRALILEAVGFPPNWDENGREGRVMRFLLDELGTRAVGRHGAPMPRDERLRRICRAIVADPARDDDLDRWADLAGMGRRTLTRRFRADTGLSLAAWRQHARLLDAVSRLDDGQSVTSVAYAVGYESVSAFTAVFQRSFGVPPSRYAPRASPFSAAAPPASASA